jgi:hypothetical protein
MTVALLFLRLPQRPAGPRHDRVQAFERGGDRDRSRLLDLGP